MFKYAKNKCNFNVYNLFLKLYLIILLLLVPVFNCQAAFAKTPQEAKDELKKLQISYNEKSFYNAISKNKVDEVSLFLEAGFNPNTKNGLKTPLIYAVKKRNLDIVKLLIRHGADVNTKNTPNNSALSIAVKQNDLSITKALLDAGADYSSEIADSNMLKMALYKPLIFLELNNRIDLVLEKNLKTINTANINNEDKNEINVASSDNRNIYILNYLTIQTASVPLASYNDSNKDYEKKLKRHYTKHVYRIINNYDNSLELVNYQVLNGLNRKQGIVTASQQVNTTPYGVLGGVVGLASVGLMGASRLKSFSTASGQGLLFPFLNGQFGADCEVYLNPQFVTGLVLLTLGRMIKAIIIGVEEKQDKQLKQNIQKDTAVDMFSKNDYIDVPVYVIGPTMPKIKFVLRDLKTQDIYTFTLN